MLGCLSKVAGADMKRALPAIDLAAPQLLHVKLRNLFSAVVALRERFEVLSLHAVQFLGTHQVALFLIAACARSA
jgi:hypothetical protein